MKHPVASLIAAAALALAGASADAQQYALTSKSLHLRAGPGPDYPVVAVLPPQMQVLVYGCIPSYTWCDVAAGYERGWVYASNLLYDYGNRVVVLPPVAAIVGIGIATFIIDDYWHEHYYDRPWWPQRQRWYRPAPVPPVHEHGRDYRDQGRDYRDYGRDYRDQGREHREPPRSGQGQYPGPRAGVAPAAPQVQRNPKDTMRRALEHPQPSQQHQQQPQQQRQQQPLPQTQ